MGRGDSTLLSKVNVGTRSVDCAIRSSRLPRRGPSVRLFFLVTRFEWMMTSRSLRNSISVRTSFLHARPVSNCGRISGSALRSAARYAKNLAMRRLRLHDNPTEYGSA